MFSFVTGERSWGGNRHQNPAATPRLDRTCSSSSSCPANPATARRVSYCINVLRAFFHIFIRHVSCEIRTHICLAREVDSSCIDTTCYVTGTVFLPAVAMNTLPLRVYTGCIKFISEEFEFELQPVWPQRRCIRIPRFGPLTDRHPTYKKNGIQKVKKEQSCELDDY